MNIEKDGRIGVEKWEVGAYVSERILYNEKTRKLFEILNTYVTNQIYLHCGVID